MKKIILILFCILFSWSKNFDTTKLESECALNNVESCTDLIYIYIYIYIYISILIRMRAIKWQLWQTRPVS